MNGALQQRLNPPQPKSALDFSEAGVKSQVKAVDGNADAPSNKTSFKDLIGNSNAEVVRSREAQKNGDVNGAKTDAEFAKMMKDKANKEAKRVPQSNLDKDAFMKLFVTQLQNQDPLNPDDSAQMASQLAQFNSLEQMLNVNKNLEKLQTEQTVGRAVNLISFVGKEIKLENGKARLQDGAITESWYSVDREIPDATLEVRDSSGTVVSTKEIGNLKPGRHKLEWDGHGSDGVKASDGLYSFNVLAKDMQGKDVPVKISTNVKVTGVDLVDAGGSFYTELGKVRINEVASVGEQSFAKKAVEGVNGSKNEAKKKEAPVAPQEATNAAKPSDEAAPQGNGGENPNPTPQPIVSAEAPVKAEDQAASSATPPAPAERSDSH